MNKIIGDLNWRYAVKKYDTTKKISAQDFNTIKESLRLSPSSFGLQPLKYIVVENTCCSTIDI
jgi:nitroreductase